MNSNKYVSGLVGYTLLKKGNKYIWLLGDIHSGVEYCDNTDLEEIFIDELLNNFINNNNNINIALEEVPRKLLDIELVELWPNDEHTQRLKEWYIKNEDIIISIDIRPFLVPFSYQKYFMKDQIHDDENNMIMTDYFNTLDTLFNFKKQNGKKHIIFFKNILKALNNKDSNKGILEMFKLLKHKYNNLKNKINLNDTFENTVIKHKNIFEQLDELKLNIMDWYTVLVLLGKGHYVCHFGLVHYMNVKEILIKNFNFEIIEEKGIHHIEDIKQLDNNLISSCIKMLNLKK